jgi:hypothetical protein
MIEPGRRSAPAPVPGAWIYDFLDVFTPTGVMC